MDGFGRAIGRGFGDLSNTVGEVTRTFGGSVDEVAGALDGAIHAILPEAIPSWLVLVLVAGLGIALLLRR
jgi:hypothetical protein